MDEGEESVSERRRRERGDNRSTHEIEELPITEDSQPSDDSPVVHSPQNLTLHRNLSSNRRHPVSLLSLSSVRDPGMRWDLAREDELDGDFPSSSEFGSDADEAVSSRSERGGEGVPRLEEWVEIVSVEEGSGDGGGSRGRRRRRRGSCTWS